MRMLRRALGWKQFSHSAFSAQAQCMSRAYRVVQFFYFFLLFLVFERYWMYSTMIESKKMSFLWPVFWIEYVNRELAIKWIYLLLLAAMILSAWQPWRRVFRIFSAVAFLLFVALYNSLGKVNDEFQCLIWISLILIFLPNGRLEDFAHSRIKKQKYLFVFWSAQFLFLFFYTLSGISKVRDTFLTDGFSLSPEIPYYVLFEYFRTGAKPVLFDVAIGYNKILVLGLPMVICVQLCSVFIAFRPRLHRAWALAIIGFHASTLLFQEVVFCSNIFIAALFLMGSPFFDLPKKDLA